MSFDINEAVFDEQGRYLEEQASRYEEALMDQFAASPEGQAITQAGTELGWARAMIHYAITYPGVTRDHPDCCVKIRLFKEVHYRR